MKNVFRFIVVLLLVVGWGLAALSLHVVRTPDEIPFTLVTKERFGLTDTYVDTRGWTLDDAARHPLLVRKLIDLKKEDVLKHIVTDERRGDVQIQLIGALQRANDKPEGEATTATQPAAAGSMLGGLFSLF